MEDINNLGTFSSINAVWKAHPEGGHEGDYLTISGVKYRWNKYLRIWENSSVVTSTLSRKTETVGGDLIVNNDAVVGDELLVRGNSRFEGDMAVEGMLYAKKVKQPNKGFFQNETALTDRYPSPEVGWWATVGDVMPGTVYRCETEGVWTNTGHTGGVDTEEVSFEIVNSLDSIDENKALSAAMGKLLLSKMPFRYLVFLNKSDRKGISVCGNVVTISNNGFGITINEDAIYYIAPEAGTGSVDIEVSVSSPHNLLCIDRTALVNENGRNNPSTCLTVLSNISMINIDLNRYIPIYYFNYVTSIGMLIGQFNDLYGTKNSDETKQFSDYKQVFGITFDHEPTEKELELYNGLSYGTISENGMTLPVGISRAIMYNNTFIFGEETIKLRLSATQSDKVLVFSNRNASIDLSDTTRSVFMLDFASGICSIYKAGTYNTSTLTGTVFKSFEFDNTAGEYEVDYGRRSRKPFVSITNLNTGKNSYIVIDEAVDGSGNNAKRPVGWFYWQPCFFTIAGSPIYKEFSGNVPSKLNAVFQGDSFTEGYGVDSSIGWAYRAAEYIGNSMVAAISGGRLSSIVSQYRQSMKNTIVTDYMIISIGINDIINGTLVSDFKALLQEYCEELVSDGITPIVNRLWVEGSFDATTAAKGAAYNQAIRELGYEGADFSSVAGYPGSTANYALSHLNENGNQKTYEIFLDWLSNYQMKVGNHNAADYIFNGNNRYIDDSTNVTITTESIKIGTNGCTIRHNGKIYYLARADRNEEVLAIDDLTSSQKVQTNGVVYIDTNKLVENGRVESIISCLRVRRIERFEYSDDMILMAHLYYGKIYPLGDFVTYDLRQKHEKSVYNHKSFPYNFQAGGINVDARLGYPVIKSDGFTYINKEIYYIASTSGQDLRMTLDWAWDKAGVTGTTSASQLIVFIDKSKLIPFARTDFDEAFVVISNTASRYQDLLYNENLEPFGIYLGTFGEGLGFSFLGRFSNLNSFNDKLLSKWYFGMPLPEMGSYSDADPSHMRGWSHHGRARLTLPTDRYDTISTTNFEMYYYVLDCHFNSIGYGGWTKSINFSLLPERANFIAIAIRDAEDITAPLTDRIEEVYEDIEWTYRRNGGSSVVSTHDYVNNILLSQQLIAHRGYDLVAPENTMPAFQAAKDAGFNIIEVDIAKTADDVQVCIHDSTIDRTSNGSGNVSDYTYEELLEFDFGSWKGQAYAGTKIPTLKEAVLFAKRNNMCIELDLADNSRYSDSMLQDTYDIIAKAGMLQNAIFTAKAARLRNLMQIDNNCMLSISSINSKAAIDDVSDLINNSRCANVSIPFADFSEELCEYAHQKKAFVKTWFYAGSSADNKTNVNNVLDLGCDYVITGKISPNDL